MRLSAVLLQGQGRNQAHPCHQLWHRPILAGQEQGATRSHLALCPSPVCLYAPRPYTNRCAVFYRMASHWPSSYRSRFAFFRPVWLPPAPYIFFCLVWVSCVLLLQDHIRQYLGFDRGAARPAAQEHQRRHRSAAHVRLGLSLGLPHPAALAPLRLGFSASGQCLLTCARAHVTCLSQLHHAA